MLFLLLLTTIILRCTHLLNGFIGRNEGNVLFNDALNTFYLRLGYMASDIWYGSTHIAKWETRCHHMGYSFRLAARVLLYASSHRQDITYNGICNTSRGALAGTRFYQRQNLFLLQKAIVTPTGIELSRALYALSYKHCIIDNDYLWNQDWHEKTHNWYF